MSRKHEKPRSKPRRWRRATFTRDWQRTRLAQQWRRRGQPVPDPRKGRPKGAPTVWLRARRLVWAWWPWSLVTVWGISTRRWGWAWGAGIMALISYLITPAETPPQHGLEHRFPIESDEFVTTISGATGVPFVGGNRVELLNNGDEFYPAMLAALESAYASITIEAYIYWEGDIGLRFAKALAAKAKAGIPVKILLDSIGSASIGRTILDTLQGGGCHIAWYNPIHWYSIGRFNNRTHRKSLIIDGRLGFTGGAGIADHWLGHAQDADHWRDMQVRVEGPAVTPLQFGFAQNWLESTGELVNGPEFYPALDRRGGTEVQTIMSSPETGASAVRIMYYLSIVSARTSIEIANPYFVPDQVAINTLIEAKRRGVRVRIMVSGIRNDNWLARQNSVRLFGPFLDAGIEILEYNRTMLHHKTMVVDGLWGTIGTTNFDNRSFAHNEENNVCFHDAALAGRLQAIFEEDAAVCEPVDRAVWGRRGLWARSQEVVASFLQDQA